MTLRRFARRRRRLLAASFVAIALVAGACADDSSPPGTLDTVATSATGIPDDHGLTDSLVDTVLPSTVGVSGVACGRLATASGFALGEDLVVTNAHVILGIDDIRIHTVDGRELAGVPVAFDPDADLAILAVDGADLTPLVPTDDTSAGATGILVGWESAETPDPTPFRIERQVTVRIETVGGTGRIERPSWLLAAEVELGDSGAALIDTDGRLVGVAFASSTQGSGVGYAVRASAVTALLADGFGANLVVPGCGEVVRPR